MPRWLNAKERFWRNVEKTESCWNWIGGKRNNGYGVIFANGRDGSAHQFSYEIHRGPIGSMHVLHKCDNKVCVNPDHLFLGTNRDNVDDKVKKNRAPRGSMHGMAIGRDRIVASVRLMRLMYEDGASAEQIANMTGRAYKTVLRVLKHQRWTNVGF